MSDMPQRSAAHPAVSLPVAERIDYAIVLATMTAVDGEIRPEELAGVRALCRRIELDDAQTESAIRTASRPDPDKVQQIVRRVRGSSLRVSLLTDLLFIAKSDREFTDKERREIEYVANELGIHKHQMEAIENYVNAVVGLGIADDEGRRNSPTATMIAALAATFVPLAAVIASGGSASGEGVAEGISRLGFGFMPIGMAVFALLGVASFQAVQWFATPRS